MKVSHLLCELCFVIMANVSFCEAQFSPEMLAGIMKGFGGGGATECKFECPSGSEPVKNPDYVPTANGCGTDFAQIQTENLETLTPCCNWHDKCFATCGKSYDKCEKGFAKCIKKKCGKLETSEKREACNKEGQMFTMMTGLMGCPLWQDSQREACLCDGKTLPKNARPDDSKFANGREEL